MYKKILVAYDGSEHAKRALNAALELVDHKLAEKILITTSYIPDTDDPAFDVAARMSGNMNEEVPETPAPIEQLRKELEPTTKKYGDVVDTFVTRAKPQDAIVTIATDNACDLIVMGRRGMSGISAMLGSVSKAVLANSSLPVFLVK